MEVTLNEDIEALPSGDTSDAPERFLSATYFFNYDHPGVAAFAEEKAEGATTPLEKAIKLYYAVRDGFRYDPYAYRLRPEMFQASHVLEAGRGFCIQKSTLMCAVARHQGVPARIGLADVRNHLATPQLLEMMGTDLFIHHGFAELYVNDHWVKSTPVFNIELCEKFHVIPLEFDGGEDSIFQPYDAKGRQHMEYVTDHGVFADLPYQRIEHDFLELYPKFFEQMAREDAAREAAERHGAEHQGAERQGAEEHDFYKEAGAATEGEQVG